MSMPMKTRFFSGKLQEIRRRQAGCYADNKVKFLKKMNSSLIFYFILNHVEYFILLF